MPDGQISPRASSVVAVVRDENSYSFSRLLRVEVRYANDSKSSADTHHACLGRHLKAMFKAWRFRRFKVRQLGFLQRRSVMSRRKQRSAFDQVSEFDTGRNSVLPREIVDYLSGKSVVVLDETKQLSGLSAKRPLLGLPLTQNHRRLRRQWCDERRMWAVEWNEVVFTDESRICLQHHDGRIRDWRHHGERMLNSCIMHCHTGPAPGIKVWDGIRYHSHTPLVRIAYTLNSQRYISEVLEPVVLPYLQGLATALFQQDNAQLHVARIVQRFFVDHQI
ncbi:transposable element Tcb1 transposase [Trichonephila clavipes]|nr:transposable element Tcb1 transposase [Trichonephila clavipes]